MTSLEDKLHSLFIESYQVKRMTKQIMNLKGMKEKKQIQLKMSLINGLRVIFNIELLLNTNKKTVQNQIRNAKIEFSISVNKQYPAEPPKLYFYGDNMQYYYLQPFRNYLSLIIIEWNPKYSLADLVRKISDFIFDEQRMKKQVAFEQRQYFEIDRILSCKFYQTFPVKLIKNRKLVNGILVVNFNQLLLFEETSLPSYFRSVDCVLLKNISGLSRNRTQPHKILIEIRKKSKDYGIQLISEQQEQIICSLMDRIRAIVPSKSLIEQDQHYLSSEDEQSEQIEFFSEEKKQAGTIQQIKDSITIYESLVDNQMTSENVSNLVILLKKAIQFYSAHNDDRFKIYLSKLQDLMKNEMTQVLIASKTDQKAISEKYMSIIYM